MLTVMRKARADLWTSELRCATGRSALWWLLSKLNCSRVLLPSYVPAGVLDPVKKAEKLIEFYRLNVDMTPDMSDLTSRINNADRSLVVVIHYFGFEAPHMAELSMVAHHNNGWLLEDCAHAYWAEAKNADFALWSLNKVMPTVDGAVLKARGFDMDCNLAVRSPSDVVQHYRHHLKFNALEMRAESERECELYYEWIASDWYPRRMTQEAEIVMRDRALLDRERDAREARVACYGYDVPSKFVLRRDLSPFSDVRVPAFAYPLVFPSSTMRDEVAGALLKTGVRAATLTRHWYEAANGDFSHRHLLLPVDESVLQKNIQQIGDCLRGFADRERVA